MSKSRIVNFAEKQLQALVKLYNKGVAKGAPKSYLKNIKDDIKKQQERLGLLKKVVR